MRFGAHSNSFFRVLIGELEKPELNQASAESQLQRDAIYQVLLVRLGNEEGIDASHLFNIVNHDLERDQSFVIVKARSIELLEKLSDFQSMQSNTEVQETLVNGITDFFSRVESGNSNSMLL